MQNCKLWNLRLFLPRTGTHIFSEFGDQLWSIELFGTLVYVYQTTCIYFLCTHRRSRGWFIRIPKPQVKPTVKTTKSSVNCQWRYGLGYLGCKKTASKTTTKAPGMKCIKEIANVIIAILSEPTSLKPPCMLQDVKMKYVKSLTTVERPLKDTKNGKHGKDAITCLHKKRL